MVFPILWYLLKCRAENVNCYTTRKKCINKYTCECLQDHNEPFLDLVIPV